MTEHLPTLVVSGYASVDYAMQLAPFEGHHATTTVRSRADEWPRYGGIAHVTRAAARAAGGAVRVAALSWVGGDAEGEAWVRAVETGGADTSGVARSGSRSPSAHLLYPEGQGAICLFDPGDCHADRLTAAQRELLATADAAVVTVGPEETTRELLTAIPAGAPVFWIVKQDPASLTAELVAELASRARLVTLSEGERGYLETVAAAAAPGAYVVVTRGSEGAELLRVGPGCELTGVGSVPAQPVTGVDTTGAGDTFSGTLVALLAAGGDPEPEEMLAHLAAASDATARMLSERRPDPDLQTDHQRDEKRNA
ncbi:carbohydrate kinase family protein [Leucobacter sp. wl10]|uniref:carbohydrate kinase family protein n=1 Tax=Leucobacter sp. wl10 TaxID=2304677 RepID=UPI000E5B3699|nr:carbohydrate kinase family protein [Leucobacter sp. wl10]RGE21552.1 carbohydrate kinase family protein [Leucobacter sp. wl10]